MDDGSMDPVTNLVELALDAVVPFDVFDQQVHASLYPQAVHLTNRSEKTTTQK
jgi:hypothetical protein